jgi:guanine deaminase
MEGLAHLQKEFSLPLQSHLSENRKEISWVQELCPKSDSYGDAYAKYGFFDGKAPVVMAHCVWSDEKEMELLRERGVYIAHCADSNTNLSSGIAPVRRFIEMGVPLGLGSDVAGGTHISIFRAMCDAIKVSKLRSVLVEPDKMPLTVEEAFYLGTAGGASFFEKAGFGPSGSFEAGCELDALVIDDSTISFLCDLSVRDRLERVLYLSDERNIKAKYVQGRKVSEP